MSAPAVESLTVITDATQAISFVNSAFERFTGFSKEEVVGRRCDFLQGDGTDPEDKEELRLAIAARKEISVVVLNYRKDRSPFWNLLTLRPVFEKPGNRNSPLTHYVGDIHSIPIPKNVSDKLLTNGERPRMCYDDALALMRVLNLQSGPTKHLLLPDEITRLEVVGSDDEEDDDNIKQEQRETSPPPVYRHQRYQKKEGAAADDATSASTTEDASSTASGDQLHFIAETLLPTKHGRFRVRAYRDEATGAEPLAMIVGDVESAGLNPVLVRVHDQCVTSEVFGSLRCDCKEQLDAGLAAIQANGGVLFYLPQEGRGIGLANKVAAYAKQELGLDTVDANRALGLPDDAREYGSVKRMLSDLNVSSIRLMTNNPRKIERLTALGVDVVERLPCVTEFNSEYALGYVKAKAARMGHIFEKRDLAMPEKSSGPPPSSSSSAGAPS